jgi:mannose-1-phosphate guanylyltransferase
MDLAREQLARAGVAEFGALVEPVARNTAPAIALVCLALDPEELVFITPSDHLMTREGAYREAVARARVLAEAGALVTFGIEPTYAETGFGYIEADGNNVVSFREKPDAETAGRYLASGRFLWNSGMFLFKAGTFLAELQNHAPELLATCRAAGGTTPTREAMQAIPSVSIDYAVMEKSKIVKVVPCDPGWSDLGSFDALFDELAKTQEGNLHLGGQPPVCVDAQNNMVVGSGRTVALVDVQDLMVIDTVDALLIVHRGSSQKVKDVVTQLKKDAPGLLE